MATSLSCPDRKRPDFRDGTILSLPTEFCKSAAGTMARAAGMRVSAAGTMKSAGLRVFTGWNCVAIQRAKVHKKQSPPAIGH
jgi:hypothetical protein